MHDLLLLYAHTAKRDAVDLSSVAKTFVFANSRQTVADPIIFGSLRTSEFLSCLEVRVYRLF